MRLKSLILGMFAVASGAAAAPAPIIDMHLHALGAGDQGPPPVGICAPYEPFPDRDTRQDGMDYAMGMFKTPPCAKPLWSAKDDADLRDRSLAMLEKYNITAVTSGSVARVAEWKQKAPQRIIAGVSFGVEDAIPLKRLRALHAAGQLQVLGELGPQYEGIGPTDPRLEPYWALAEELDVPVAIHMGPGPPGAPYLPGLGTYRMALSNPLLLEDVLVKHPKLRLYVMHAGWPMSDAMVALLYAHPQVYVDTGVIDYVLPRAEFHRHLQRLVEAGFGKRIMFGSDQMVWPDAIPIAIANIESARFLSAAQRRDILHDNAARFLRLPDAPK
jgi:predicted TIM-barrel fold metal-dependent hydrolase